MNPYPSRHKSMRINNFKRLHRLSNWYTSRFTFPGKCIVTSAVITALLGINVFRGSTYQLFAVFISILLIAILASRLIKRQCYCKRILPKLATVGEPLNYKVAVTNNTKNIINNLFLVDTLVENYPSRAEFVKFFDSKSQSENWFDKYVGFPRWSRLLKWKTGAQFPQNTISVDNSGQENIFKLELVPLRRGYIHFSHFQIGQSELTGLFRKTHSQPCTDKLLVLPKRYALSPINMPGKQHHNQGGVALASSIGETTEFQGLRDYRPGDPLRHIHWRSWARTGSPVVKKFEDEFFVRHALILDTYANSQLQDAFEKAVSVAASIALGIEERESLLDLMFVENKAYCFTTGRHVDDTLSLLEILSCVNLENKQSFSTLTKMVTDHCDLLTSAIFVCLSWDDSRKQLVENLVNRGIEVAVVLLGTPGVEIISTDEQLGPMANLPHRFLQLHTDNIEKDIHNISEIFSK